VKLQVIDLNGAKVREIDAADEVFGIEPNAAVVHQAYVAQMSNRRAGLASTKRRGEVQGSSAKTRRQKGLGRSRQGSIRASHRVGGGVAMGPKPHAFNRSMPRRMKRLALRSALSSHAGAGTLLVVDGLVPAEPKTKVMREALRTLGVERSALLVTGAHEPALRLASQNLARIDAVPAAVLNVVSLVNAHQVLMTEDAVRAAEALWGGDNLGPLRGRRPAEVS
jgi:large subunit ribosomal protein L4